MARKPQPPVSYDDELALPGAEPLAPATPPPSIPPVAAPPVPEPVATMPVAASPPAPEPARSGRRPILDKSDPTIVYLDPRGKHQLRQYAVAQGLKVRVHDLLLEAIEEWAARKGLPGPFRSPNSRPPRMS
jgi:hypothetical protein